MGNSGRGGFDCVRRAKGVTGRILVLTPEPPESGGGTEHFVREVLRALGARGYRTEVFHCGNSEPAWLSNQTGRLGKKLAGTLRGYWIGRNAQRHMGEDVVAAISNSDIGIYPLRRAAPFKAIHIYHGTYRGQSEAIRPFIKYGGYLYMKWWGSMVLERLSGRGKLVLACSEQACDEVLRFFGHDSIAVWCPINTEHFKPRDIGASRATLRLPKDKAIGLFVGSMHPMKGFPVVQSLIERLPEIHWVLALRGEVPREHVQRRNVTILHNVPHDRVPLLYSAADFSLCPSLYEPFGYVVAESLACGIPVIASPGGASRLFLHDAPVNRLLVSGRDSVDGFLVAVQEVLREPDLYRKAIIEQVRPKIEELMAPENWSRRFFEVTGL
jgi:glycosyltransferase involved in cell wall biosynthesis